MSPCLLSQIQLVYPMVRQAKRFPFERFTAQIYCRPQTLLLILSVFYPGLLVKGEVPTPAIAAEGDEMSIDRYGKYSVYFCVVVLWFHCIQVMLSYLSLSENVGYINGQVQPEGKTRNTSFIPKFELHTK